MAKSLEEFRSTLLASGVIDAQQLQEFEASLSPPRKNAEELAKSLVQHRKLTKYQAAHIYQANELPLVLGSYLIEDKIAAGGMGRVYKGRHRRIDRTIAIKLLPPETVKSPKAIKRFYREARAAARLNHPNIVRAYDMDEHQGIHYLVMEYVPGKDLASIVKQDGPLEFGLVTNCILQAAEGLAYAHDQGIIHRDIKPANLLVTRRGPGHDEPIIKILDMGLARISTAAGIDDDSVLTRTGQVMGSVDYMSPEQATDTRTADQRSDVYSLGCTLYVLLTGKLPFYEKSVLKRVLAHREKPVPDARELRPEIPSYLAELCQRMMAKRPEERPQSMSEVIESLQARGDGSAKLPPAAPAPKEAAPPKVRTAETFPPPGAAQSKEAGSRSAIYIAVLIGVVLMAGTSVLAVVAAILSYLF